MHYILIIFLSSSIKLQRCKVATKKSVQNSNLKVGHEEQGGELTISANLIERVKEARKKSKELSKSLDRKMRVSYTKLQRVISR